MATQILSFINIFRARAARVRCAPLFATLLRRADYVCSLLTFINKQAAISPNSWAVVCLWRRFFALQEEEQDERKERFLRALEADLDEDTFCPIASDEAVLQRREFVRSPFQRPSILAGPDWNHNRRRNSDFSTRGLLGPLQTAQDERLAENRPNLDIAGDGSFVFCDDYRHLPQ